jgi:hypothetical protein
VVSDVESLDEVAVLAGCTPLQRWVLRGVADGRSVASLARERGVSEGAVWQSKSAAVTRLRRYAGDGNPAALTERQQAVVDLRNEGYVDRRGRWHQQHPLRYCAIALGTSHQAVAKHLARVEAKLASTRTPVGLTERGENSSPRLRSNEPR